jgi:hypothetical protein
MHTSPAVATMPGIVARAAALMGIALTASSLHAQAHFEGVVYQQFTIDKEQTAETYYTKGNKARIEIRTSQGTVVQIIDAAANTMYVILPEAKSYTVSPYTDTAEQHRFDKVIVTRLGTTHTIAGHRCTDWHIVNPEQSTADMCIATDLGPSLESDAASRAVMAKIAGNGQGFVLQSNAKAQDLSVTIVTTRIEPKTLDPSLFAAPAGYTNTSR